MHALSQFFPVMVLLRTLALGGLFLPLLMLSGCAPKPSVYAQESFVFGTRVEVLVYGVAEDRARAGMATVLREFDRMHQAYHAWQTSELTRLNQAIARGERAIPVSAELAEMLREAKEISERGDELFDPALGRLIALWGFHNDEFKPVLPDATELARLVAIKPRMSDLSIQDNQVSSRNRAVSLDLGGYAKGFALDRAAALLKAAGIDNALINIGGNVMALGSKGDKPWRIGIQHPRSTTPLATLTLKDGEAVGTSGDYQRYFELDGQRYCHILDPRTGMPATGTEAVTILIPGGPKAGMRSDAASKPLFLGGADKWRHYAVRLGIDHALRVDDQGVVQVTPALRRRLTFPNQETKVIEMPLPQPQP